MVGKVSIFGSNDLFAQDLDYYKPFYIDGIVKHDNSEEVWGYSIRSFSGCWTFVSKEIFSILVKHGFLEKSSLDGLSKGVYGGRHFKTLFNSNLPNNELPIYTESSRKTCNEVVALEDNTLGVNISILDEIHNQVSLEQPKYEVHKQDEGNQQIEQQKQKECSLYAETKLVIPPELTVKPPFIESLISQLYPKYSIKYIAEWCGVSTSTVSRWIKQFNLK